MEQYRNITLRLVLATVLSLGLNLLIARLGLNPRWKYALWIVIALNEIRGAAVVYTVLQRDLVF